MDQAAFLTLILGGVVALVLARLRTRLNWKPDAPPYREVRTVDIILRPGQYAREDAVAVIRSLNIVGLLALAGAVGILAYKAYRDLWGG